MLDATSADLMSGLNLENVSTYVCERDSLRSQQMLEGLQTSAKLNHPSIVRIVGVVEAGTSLVFLRQCRKSESIGDFFDAFAGTELELRAHARDIIHLVALVLDLGYLFRKDGGKTIGRTSTGTWVVSNVENLVEAKDELPPDAIRSPSDVLLELHNSVQRVLERQNSLSSRRTASPTLFAVDALCSSMVSAATDTDALTDWVQVMHSDNHGRFDDYRTLPVERSALYQAFAMSSGVPTGDSGPTPIARAVEVEAAGNDDGHDMEPEEAHEDEREDEAGQPAFGIVDERRTTPVSRTALYQKLVESTRLSEDIWSRLENLATAIGENAHAGAHDDDDQARDDERGIRPKMTPVNNVVTRNRIRRLRAVSFSKQKKRDADADPAPTDRVTFL